MPSVFNKRAFPEIKDKHFILAFDHADKSVSLKNAFRLLNKTVSENVKREFRAKKINTQNKKNTATNIHEKCGTERKKISKLKIKFTLPALSSVN